MTNLASITTKEPLETLFPNISKLVEWVGEVPTYSKRKGKDQTIAYYNVPCAFDIEFTSAYVGEDHHKAGIMYLWSFCINGGVIQGRTWDEWVMLCQFLVQYYDLSQNKRLIIFCRNLETEFQFMRGWFSWASVFAVKERRPVYAVTTDGIEFRCSYILSGESLKASGEKLRTYKVRKLVGDLDYSLYRHSKTPLTDNERAYAINDVRVDVAYIAEKMEEVDYYITRLQLTNTGYVRKYMRDQCFYTGSHKRNGWKMLAFKERMSRLTLEPEEYILNRRAFQGGFTHASARFSGTEQHDVDSWDITSSYPYAMVAYRYPMSKGEKIRITSADEFRRNLKLYCCVFDIEFVNLCIKDIAPDCPLSKSKCYNIKGELVENNGRIARCDGSLVTTITNIDFQIYEQFYTWDAFRVGTFYRYMRGYLPTEIVNGILTLYEKKTTLKGVKSEEREYNMAKSRINSCFGMIVTDICRDENKYKDGEWSINKCNVEEEIEKYNNNQRRFLYYPWGIFVTAYARLRLFRAIWAIGEHGYYYSDTDSCKIVDGNVYRNWFLEENKRVTERLNKALSYHRIDPSRGCPKTVKGVEKPLGVWDFEGEENKHSYTRFKALRAKCYMTESEDGINITVSGVNKGNAVPYLVKTYADPFEAFDDHLSIPPDYTGKLTHIYIDVPMSGELTDYTGQTAPFYEHSAIHLEKAGYEMSLALQYVEFLKGYRERVL